MNIGPNHQGNEGSKSSNSHYERGRRTWEIDHEIEVTVTIVVKIQKDTETDHPTEVTIRKRPHFTKTSIAIHAIGKGIDPVHTTDLKANIKDQTHPIREKGIDQIVDQDLTEINRLFAIVARTTDILLKIAKLKTQWDSAITNQGNEKKNDGKCT